MENDYKIHSMLQSGNFSLIWSSWRLMFQELFSRKVVCHQSHTQACTKAFWKGYILWILRDLNHVCIQKRMFLFIWTLLWENYFLIFHIQNIGSPPNPDSPFSTLFFLSSYKLMLYYMLYGCILTILVSFKND